MDELKSKKVKIGTNSLKNIVIIILSIVYLTFAQSNHIKTENNDNNSKNIFIHDTIIVKETPVVKDTIVVKDTVYLVGSSKSKSFNNENNLENYYSILEKTNNQLSLWFNPYSILVGSLSLLFTAMTIIAAIILYRQGKEYRNRQLEIENKYKDRLDEFLNEKNKQIKITEESYKEIIEQYKEKIAIAGTKQKEELEQEIKKLEADKNQIKTHISASVPVITRNFHECSNCGFGFEVLDNTGLSLSSPAFPSLYTSAFGGNQLRETKTVTCPKCGNIDKIY